MPVVQLMSFSSLFIRVKLFLFSGCARHLCMLKGYLFLLPIAFTF